MAANRFLVVSFVMCGRKTLTRDMVSIIEDLSVEHWEVPDDYNGSYNIAPTQFSPVMINNNGRTVRNMRWGLVPSWAKDNSFAAKTINARIETLREKPAFRNLVDRRRCVVLADGYYEWSSDKTPWYIYPKDNSLLLMAGLWDTWESNNEKLDTYTIITMPAISELADIHHRMPASLTVDSFAKWIGTSEHSYANLEPLLKKPEMKFSKHTVSKLVNSLNNNGPDCISPFYYPAQTQLF